MAVAPPRTRHLSVAVIADAHLGTARARGAELLNYLESISPEILVIAGDLVDLDAMTRNELSALHLSIVRRILDLAHRGTRVYYLTGNHEQQLRRMGDLALGNLHVRREAVLQIEGERYFIFHGDDLDAAVKHRLSGKRLGSTRHRILGFGESLSKRLRGMLGKEPWSLAREVENDTPTSVNYLAAYKELALQKAASRGCTRVICAHVHAPALEQATDALYLNAGDWVTNQTALELRFGRWSVHHHEVTETVREPLRNRSFNPPLPQNRMGQSSGEVLRRILEAGPTQHS